MYLTKKEKQKIIDSVVHHDKFGKRYYVKPSGMVVTVRASKWHS